ncbi:hypothetical protein DF011_14060 [Burkholderia ubonensis]|nr:hypothetical protein DF013_29705 [Burkholderia ubonensis]RQP84841.1 hypothetical protein DF014_14050 [Burkholderia ubonensis]RQQ12986.1 hypothetical protein DF011_14060 [Burkholderia ubonensis]
MRTTYVFFMTMPCFQRTLALVIAMQAAVESARERRHVVERRQGQHRDTVSPHVFISMPYQHVTRSPLAWMSCTASDERSSELRMRET